MRDVVQRAHCGERGGERRRREGERRRQEGESGAGVARRHSTLPAALMSSAAAPAARGSRGKVDYAE